MSEKQSIERQPARPPKVPLSSQVSHAPENLPGYPSSLLGDARLNARGNQHVRIALMRQMQQTYGNRAVQRYFRRLSQAAPTTDTQGVHLQQCGGQGYEGCACAVGLEAQEQERPASISPAVQRQPAATALPSTATTGTRPPSVPQDMAQEAISYLQRMAGFVRDVRESVRLMLRDTTGHPITAEQRRRAHSILSQERVGRFLHQARSIYEAQLQPLPANDARRGQLYEAYVSVLGEIHGAADMALNVSNGMDAATRDAERPLYAQNVAQCVVSSLVTSTLGSTPASQSSALPDDVLAAHARHMRSGNMQGALQVVVDAMRARGEMDDRLMATEAVTGRDADCANTNPYIVDSGVNGANTTTCSCFGPEGARLPNPRMRFHPDMIRRVERLHSTLLHEFRHVRQLHEECNQSGHSPSVGGVCTDCNSPSEMDAYLAQIEAGYDPQEIRSGWVRVFTNWSYLAPEQQRVFQARRDAAQQKVERLFPDVNWVTDAAVMRYNTWCQNLTNRIGTETRGTCDDLLAPLNRPVPAAGQRRR
jgi:hypothetical protein